jgi:hypothetical protein
MTVAVSVSIFFWNPMGNSLEAYRSAIGMFYNCSRISSKCVLVQADSYRNILLTNLRCSFLFVSLLVLQSLNPNVNVVFLLFVLHFILMIGNVELNPGPETYISSSPPNLDNSSSDNSISLCNINIRSIEKIDPSLESEPKDFHLNYSLVGLSLKCLHFLSYKSEAPLPFDSVCRGVGYFLWRNIIQYRLINKLTVFFLVRVPPCPPEFKSKCKCCLSFIRSSLHLNDR